MWGGEMIYSQNPLPNVFYYAIFTIHKSKGQMKMTTKDLKALKQKMLDCGPSIPGTIREVFLRCGRNNCACAEGKKIDRHGPYYFWSYKRDGRLTSVSLAAEDLVQFREWIENRRRFEALLEEVLEAGAKEALRRKKNGPDTKPRKRGPSTRGD